jgi:hypothetical protein
MKIKPHANINSQGLKKMSALIWITVSSFHIFSDFVTPLRLTHTIHASWASIHDQHEMKLILSRGCAGYHRDHHTGATGSIGNGR